LVLLEAARLVPDDAAEQRDGDQPGHVGKGQRSDPVNVGL
jgi:hypothetical protein